MPISRQHHDSLEQRWNIRRDESSIQRLTAAELAGSLAFTSAKMRFEAVSIDSMSRNRNSLLGRPGGIGSRNSTTIVPGLLRRLRLGQNRPELSATGTQGMPSAS